MANYYETLGIGYKDELSQANIQTGYQNAINKANVLTDANTKRARIMEANKAREEMLKFAGDPAAKENYLKSLNVTEPNKDNKEAQKDAADSVKKRMMNASVENYKNNLEDWRKRHPDEGTTNPGGDMVSFLFLELCYFNRGSIFDPKPSYKGFDSKNLEKMYIPELNGPTVSALEAEFIKRGELTPIKDKDGKVIGGEFTNKDAQERFKGEMKKLQATSEQVAEALKSNRPPDAPEPPRPGMRVS